MTQQTKTRLTVTAMVVAFVALVAGVFLYTSWWLKVPSAILAVVLGFMLVRMYLSHKRKKYAIQGKILSATPPKNRFKVGKYTYIVKSGKVSKKLYSWQNLNLKVGQNYALYYEEKSNQIIKHESLKLNMASRPKGNIPPQFR